MTVRHVCNVVLDFIWHRVVHLFFAFMQLARVKKFDSLYFLYKSIFFLLWRLLNPRTKICWRIKSSNNDKNHIYVYAYTFLSICMRFLICAHECRNYTTCVKYLTPVELIFIYVSFLSLVMWNTFVATLYVTMYSFTRLLSYFSHFLFFFSELVAGDLHRFDYLLWFFSHFFSFSLFF